MKVRFKVMDALLAAIRDDLRRPHAFAHERVGFIAAGLSAWDKGLLVLAREYRPVADDEYLDDRTVGAMMGPNAIRNALQWALQARCAIFHVHTHNGSGVPRFSGTDLRENAKFVPDFFKVAPECAHGAIVLSDTAAHGLVWLSRSEAGVPISSFVSVGVPLRKWGSP